MSTSTTDALTAIGVLAVAEMRLNAAMRAAADRNDPAVWDYRDMWEAKRRELAKAVYDVAEGEA